MIIDDSIEDSGSGSGSGTDDDDSDDIEGSGKNLKIIFTFFFSSQTVLLCFRSRWLSRRDSTSNCSTTHSN